jgi:Lipocalin-like domain
MNRRDVASLSVITALSFAFVPAEAGAQQKTLKEQLVGTWTLLTHEIIARDGTKTALFGPHPKGLLIFDAGGHYVQIQVRPDRPKFKANNRLEGTAEENKAALTGGIGQFGTWSLNETDKTLTLHEDGNVSYPNEEDTDQRRVVTLSADDLKVLIALSDGGKIELVYRRAKSKPD